MAVRLKKKESKDEKLRIVGMGVEDHTVVVGTKENTFFSKPTVVHIVQAEKLIKKGLAKQSNLEIEEVVNPNRQVLPVSASA